MLSPLERRLLDRALTYSSSATAALDSAKRLLDPKAPPEVRREVARAVSYQALATRDLNRITHPGDYRDAPGMPAAA